MKFKYILESVSFEDSLKMFDVKKNEYSENDINRKFKKLALKLHPDRGGTKEQMQDLNDARDILLKNLSSKFDTVKTSSDYTETMSIVSDIIRKYFDNLDIGKFKSYFDNLFNDKFDYDVKYSKFLENPNKYDMFAWADVSFYTSDRNKIVEFSISVHTDDLYWAVINGNSLSSDDMNISYRTNIFANGKKFKVAQKNYNDSNKKEILMNPKIMFPEKKMKDIASGDKRKNAKLKKADFVSLICTKHKGEFLSNYNTFRIPICNTSENAEEKVYMYVDRDTIMRIPAYNVSGELQFYFANGKPSFADKMKDDFKKMVSDNNKNCGYRTNMYETSETLDFLDRFISDMEKTDFKDLLKTLKKYLDEISKINELSAESYDK